MHRVCHRSRTAPSPWEGNGLEIRLYPGQLVRPELRAEAIPGVKDTSPTCDWCSKTAAIVQSSPACRATVVRLAREICVNASLSTGAVCGGGGAVNRGARTEAGMCYPRGAAGVGNRRPETDAGSIRTPFCRVGYPRRIGRVIPRLRRWVVHIGGARSVDARRVFT